MHKKLLGLSLLAAIFLLLASCASPGQKQKKSHVVKSIALLPVNDPTWFSLENRNAVSYLSPITALGFKMDSRDKAKIFTKTALSLKFPLGKNLEDTIRSELEKRGYKVILLEGMRGPPDDPDNIDYSTIKTDADGILQVYFSDVGVFSSSFSSSYLPRCNISGIIFSPQDGSYLYDETLYYGVDAREGESWGISADPEFAFPTFDVLIENIGDVMAGFDRGSRALAKLMGERIQKSL